MKKIFLVYGHYNDKSFNAAIRDTFIETAERNGNKVDCVDLYKEKFNPVFAGEQPDEDVLNHRNRIEKCDTIVLIAPIWNFRMPAIVEGWIDKVLAPPWAFSFKRLVGNYGYPQGHLKEKKAIICDVIMDPEQYFHPKLSTSMSKNGRIISPPLEDLSPLLKRNELQKSMIIPLHKKSKSIIS